MRILKTEKLTHEKWLNLFAANIEHNGHQARWIFASRKPEPFQPIASGDAVIIIPILHVPGQPPRLVLIKEFRVPVGTYTWGFPAGLLEPGESIEETVKREMLEETGFEVTAVKKISPPLLSSSGMTDETAAMAFVDVQPSTHGKPALEGTEDLAVVFLDFEGVCQVCNNPQIPIDAKAWSSLYLYQRLGQLI